MQYLIPDIEKSKGFVPFRDWNGQLVVTVACGGWRRARSLDLALLRQVSHRIVTVRDEVENG